MRQQIICFLNGLTAYSLRLTAPGRKPFAVSRSERCERAVSPVTGTGFTLIELIVSIVIAGIILISFAASYRQIISGLIYDSELSKAIGLSQLEFSIANSISYTDPTLAGGYNNLSVNYQGSGYDVRRQVSYDFGSDVTTQSLKRITITVYRTGSAAEIMKTATLRAKNVTYGP